MAEITRIRCLWTGVAGTPWYTNLYFEGGAATADAARDAVVGFLTDMLPVVSSDVTAILDIQATIIETTTGQPVGVATVDPYTAPGGNVNDMLPRTTQCLIRWDTGVFLNGRQVRGRTFIPGMCENFNDDGGIPNAAFIAGVAETATALLEEPGNPQLVVWSRSTSTAQLVTGAAVWTQWAVLKSRRD